MFSASILGNSVSVVGSPRTRGHGRQERSFQTSAYGSSGAGGLRSPFEISAISAQHLHLSTPARSISRAITSPDGERVVRWDSANKSQRPPRGGAQRPQQQPAPHGGLPRVSANAAGAESLVTAAGTLPPRVRQLLFRLVIQHTQCLPAAAACAQAHCALLPSGAATLLRELLTAEDAVMPAIVQLLFLGVAAPDLLVHLLQPTPSCSTPGQSPDEPAPAAGDAASGAPGDTALPTPGGGGPHIARGASGGSLRQAATPSLGSHPCLPRLGSQISALDATPSCEASDHDISPRSAQTLQPRLLGTQSTVGGGATQCSSPSIKGSATMPVHGGAPSPASAPSPGHSRVPTIPTTGSAMNLSATMPPDGNQGAGLGGGVPDTALPTGRPPEAEPCEVYSLPTGGAEQLACPAPLGTGPRFREKQPARINLPGGIATPRDEEIRPLPPPRAKPDASCGTQEFASLISAPGVSSREHEGLPAAAHVRIVGENHRGSVQTQDPQSEEIERLREAWEEVADAQAAISCADLARLFCIFMPETSPREAQRLAEETFGVIDGDGSGSITFDELRDYLYRGTVGVGGGGGFGGLRMMGVEGIADRPTNWREWLWALVEEPVSALYRVPVLRTASLAWSWTMQVVILASIANLMVESLPEMQNRDGGEGTVFTKSLELGSIIVFTVEFTLRCIACPCTLGKYGQEVDGDSDEVPRLISQSQYWRLAFTWVDLLSILPVWVMLAANGGKSNGDAGAFMVVRTFRLVRLVRVTRVLKLGRHSQGVELMLLAIQKAALALLWMTLLMGMTITVFASLIFTVEVHDGGHRFDHNQSLWVRDEPSGRCLPGRAPFQSMPDAMWWALVTLTTVGYGDVYPCTDWGRVIACGAMFVGIILLAYPLTILGRCYNEVYQEFEDQKRIAFHRQSIFRAVAGSGGRASVSLWPHGADTGGHQHPGLTLTQPGHLGAEEHIRSVNALTSMFDGQGPVGSMYHSLGPSSGMVKSTHASSYPPSWPHSGRERSASIDRVAALRSLSLDNVQNWTPIPAEFSPSARQLPPGTGAARGELGRRKKSVGFSETASPPLAAVRVPTSVPTATMVSSPLPSPAQPDLALLSGGLPQQSPETQRIPSGPLAGVIRTSTAVSGDPGAAGTPSRADHAALPELPGIRTLHSLAEASEHGVCDAQSHSTGDAHAS
eukprot:TRINITY_DN46786_c0_g1_i1.p1 TRINITY_DN46786_c0_g1~~TRINITY_DN46786_c0_g1_i1.p1  ORF type:complete len:1182 (+),score=100.63 TRINITY_DN46786_c0_g1_i1:100-3645(+)